MNGRADSDKELEDDRDDVEDDAVALSDDDDDDDGDDLLDITSEVNVEELIAKLDASDADDCERRRAIRRRLEELQDEIGDRLDSTYNINLDDDD